MHRDGRLVQLPFEEQVNNTVAADMADAIGLRRYSRKGIIVFRDYENAVPLYCPTEDCWAKANPKFHHFCSVYHLSKTLPNQFDDAGEIRTGLMAQGVTTTRIWRA